MNYINIIGLHFYIYIYYLFNSYIALTIYINGILYHSSNIKFFLINDYIFNIYFIIYGTLYSNYNINPIFTITSLILYMIKKYILKINKNTILDQCLHVMFIQLPFAYTLYKMEELL